MDMIEILDFNEAKAEHLEKEIAKAAAREQEREAVKLHNRKAREKAMLDHKAHCRELEQTVRDKVTGLWDQYHADCEAHAKAIPDQKQTIPPVYAPKTLLKGVWRNRLREQLKSLEDYLAEAEEVYHRSNMEQTDLDTFNEARADVVEARRTIERLLTSS
jgi:hypothetical protein